MFDLSDKVASFYFSTLKKNGITCTIIWIPEISIFNSFHYLHRYFWGPSFSFFISHSSSGESNARTFWAVYKCICKGIWIWGKFRVILWTLACFYCHYVPGLEKRITWFCQNLLLSLLKTILKKKKSLLSIKKKKKLFTVFLGLFLFPFTWSAFVISSKVDLECVKLPIVRIIRMMAQRFHGSPCFLGWNKVPSVLPSVKLEVVLGCHQNCQDMDYRASSLSLSFSVLNYLLCKQALLTWYWGTRSRDIFQSFDRMLSNCDFVALICLCNVWVQVYGPDRKEIRGVLP